MIDNLNGLVAIVVIFAGLFVAGNFLNFVRKKIVENAELNSDNEYEPLAPNIEIDEISENENPLPENILNPESDTGDVSAAERMLILDDGLTIRDKNKFEFDPDNEVTVLKRNQNLNSFIFKDHKVFKFDDYKIGNKVGELSDPPLGLIRSVLPINENRILIAADLADSRYPDTHLWQVSTDTFEQKEIAKDIYFIHKRPSKVFMSDPNNDPTKNQEIIVIYYTGEERFFSYGGGETKPKHSVVRVYNNQYPEGQDLVEFNYKAGTILDVKWQNGSLILFGDPSPPRSAASKPRLPARVWKLTR